MENIVVKMDIRGFIRFPDELVKSLKLDKMIDKSGEGPYADIEIDIVGKRIAITPSKTLKPTSFHFLKNTASSGYLLYLKGALNLIDTKIETGAYTLTKEGSRLVFTGKKPAKKKGEWQVLACRNSVGLTMLSIDSRGTIIFDKRSCGDKVGVNTAVNKTMKADYDEAKKEFKLTFSKDSGFINVRTIASHANASFMGTLSSHGIALPKKSFRTASKINGKVLTFSAAALVNEQKAAAKAAKAAKKGK
ncbi:MAG: hypothetical protein HUK21_00230 [Fibrobacteraceae bacterium]|nr:hypothetical protein [Fibrobacteraceae bacterium]